MIFSKGHIPWNKGKEGLYYHSEEAKQKISLANKGKPSWSKGKRGVPHAKGQIPWNKGLKGVQLCSQEQRLKLSKIFKGRTSPFKGKHHADKCRKKMSAERTGEQGSMFGKHHSQETRRKISLAQKGKHLSKETKLKMSISGKKKTIPLLTRLKISKSSRGSRHHAWKGGVTSLIRRIRDVYLYRQWRSDVFTRDGFICQKCEIKGGFLQAHHIKPFSLILIENKILKLDQAYKCMELWNINNGITLCKACHNLITKTNTDV